MTKARWYPVSTSIREDDRPRVAPGVRYVNLRKDYSVYYVKPNPAKPAK